MVDPLKKVLYSAVGLAYLTKEKAEELGRKLVQDINLSEEDGKKFLHDLVQKSQDVRESMKKAVGEMVEGTLKKLDVPTRDEIRELRSRIAKLEQAAEKGD